MINPAKVSLPSSGFEVPMKFSSPLTGYVVNNRSIREAFPHQSRFWQYVLAKVTSKNVTRVVVPGLAEAMESGDWAEILEPFGEAYVGSGGKSVYISDPNGGKKGRPAGTRYTDALLGGATTSEFVRAYLTTLKEVSPRHVGNNGKAPNRVMWGCQKVAHYILTEPSIYNGAPSYFQPHPTEGVHVGNFEYWDLKAAYWQIYKHATLDMAFNPHSPYLGVGKIRHYDVDEIEPVKDFRVSMVGMLSLHRTEVYNYGSLRAVESTARNLFYAPDLHLFTMFVLNAVAQEIIDNFGALMVLADAFIVPAGMGHLVEEFLMDRWGLKVACKGAGPGVLYGLNCYQVGDKKSSHAPASPLGVVPGKGQVPTPDYHCSMIKGIEDLTEFLQDRRQWLMSLNLPQSDLVGVANSVAKEKEDKSKPESASSCIVCNSDISSMRAGTKFCTTKCRVQHNRSSK